LKKRLRNIVPHYITPIDWKLLRLSNSKDLTVLKSQISGFFAKADPHRAHEIARQDFHGSHPPALTLAAIEADPGGYLSAISNSEKCHQNELSVFARTISFIQFDT
jgi:hypothetical protein